MIGDITMLYVLLDQDLCVINLNQNMAFLTCDPLYTGSKYMYYLLTGKNEVVFYRQ